MPERVGTSIYFLPLFFPAAIFFAQGARALRRVRR
jgi:hypothetical protein